MALDPSTGGRGPRDRCYDKFLVTTLGRYLPDCLTEVTENRPKDPIEYISSWLYKAYDSDFYLKEKEKYLRDVDFNVRLLEMERLERQARMQPLLDALEEERLRMIQAEKEERDALIALTEISDDVDPVLKQRLAALTREHGLPPPVVKDESIAGDLEGDIGEDGQRVGAGGAGGRGGESGWSGEESPDHYGSRRASHRKSLKGARHRASEGGLGSPTLRGRGSQGEGSLVGVSASRESVDSAQSQSRRRMKAAGRTARDGSMLPPLDAKGRRMVRRGEDEEGEETYDEKGVRLPGIKRKGKKGRLRAGEEEDTAEKAKRMGKSPKLPPIGAGGWSADDYLTMLPPDSVQMTTKGNVAYFSGDLGLLAPPSIHYRKLAPSDDPEEWERRGFHCMSHYEHELYTQCNIYYTEAEHRNLPTMSMAEYLEPTNRIQIEDESDFI